ncbi:uncharacterized protein FIBRA_00206 [Fibroporia radiculosa]|uniref:Methionyl-tRNA formyltransferase n=1 Tax=Fibroporia radiculosa TaxID=599839 RepID=J7RGL9_9APHY|nr:uncharacterized protein FIBRA_00206 [Fibroporia radiculosa]CCL98212.1 predicted protein [Fibroporia radiculosa]
MQPPAPFSSALASAPPHPHVLITASFGRILPKTLLDLFSPSLRLNVHPSLLPVYRGAAPIQHALLDGQKETGVCIIEMMERNKGIDAGGIWNQKLMDIPENATFVTLRDILGREGGDLLVSALRDILAGKATLMPQTTDAAARRAPVITSNDAIVNFTTMTAEDIVRRYRAISHQKPIIAYLKTNRSLQLHSPSVLTDSMQAVDDILTAPGTAIYHSPSASLLIRCASNSILSVPQVKQQDRSMLKAKDWWNGVRPEMRLSGGDEGPVQFVRTQIVES